MGVLVVSGCTANGGRALHIAVISDKKNGTVSILWRTDPYTCDREILRASDIFFAILP